MTTAGKFEAIPWETVARLLFKDLGVSEGLWHLGVGLRFAGITSSWQEPGSTEIDLLPTALVGMTGLGLRKVDRPGAMVFVAPTGRSSVQSPEARQASKPKAAKPQAKADLPPLSTKRRTKVKA
jgi:hypothetical protein